MTEPCPPRSQLERLLLARLDPALDEALRRHIEGCPSCQAALDQLSRVGDPSGPRPLVDHVPAAPEGVIRRLKERRPASSWGQAADGSLRQPADSGRSSKTETAALPQLPGYEIFDEVGRCGMGVIYRARQITLDRLVAVKMLRPSAQTSATALDCLP